MAQTLPFGTGRALGVFLPAQAAEVVNVDYIATLVTQAFYVAPAPMIVTGIIGRPSVAGTDGSAVSLSFYKCGAGVTPANGTILHNGSYNLKGTIHTNQILDTVSSAGTSSPNPLVLAAGDALAYVLTGTATAAVGVFCITLEYL